MKFRILLAGVLLAFCGSVVRGSGCTNLSYSKTGDDKIYGYDSLRVQYIQKETVTYTVTCTDSNTGATLLGPVSNAATGYGTTGCNTHGTIYCTDFPCNPQFGTVVTPGDSFDNQAFNGAVANNTSSSAACTPGPLQQDNTTTCPFESCCANPSGPPPYCGQNQSPSWDPINCWWNCVPNGNSPILIDVSGHGFELTSALGGVTYDISGNGSAIQMGWTSRGAQNAFLCLPDAYGNCNSGKQLFGNFTPQPASSTPNGFAALAVYDGNSDGVIDARDAIFSSLRLWIDANHDGISQPNELFTLPQLGVTSISLNYKWDRRTDQYGNVFRYRAQVGSTDGAGRMAYDVFFVSQPSGTTAALKACPPRPMLAPIKEKARLR